MICNLFLFFKFLSGAAYGATRAVAAASDVLALCGANDHINDCCRNT